MNLFSSRLKIDFARLQSDIEQLLNVLFEQLDSQIELDRKKSILQDFEESKNYLKRLEIL
jgi:hypothetical protein